MDKAQIQETLRVANGAQVAVEMENGDIHIGRYREYPDTEGLHRPGCANSSLPYRMIRSVHLSVPPCLQGVDGRVSPGDFRAQSMHQELIRLMFDSRKWYIHTNSNSRILVQGIIAVGEDCVRFLTDDGEEMIERIDRIVRIRSATKGPDPMSGLKPSERRFDKDVGGKIAVFDGIALRRQGWIPVTDVNEPELPDGAQVMVLYASRDGNGQVSLTQGYAIWSAGAWFYGEGTTTSDTSAMSDEDARQAGMTVSPIIGYQKLPTMDEVVHTHTY